MDFSKTDLEIFSNLGLSKLQSKTYLALIKLGIATVQEIANFSGIARQDIYRITRELDEKGLIRKELSIPKKFEAVPIDEGINILEKEIEKKQKENKKKIQKLIERYKKNLKEDFQKKDFSLSIIPKKDAIQYSIEQIKNSKKTIAIITSHTNAKFLSWNAKKEIKEALKRKIKIRIIFDKPEDNKKILPQLDFLKAHPLFKIKLLKSIPITGIAIYDNIKMSLILKPKEPLGKTQLLISNNEALQELVNDYFEIKWLTAIEYNQGN